MGRGEGVVKRFFALFLVLASLLAFAGCGEKVDEYPVAWEYVTGLPAGFPTLSEKLTTSNESYSSDKAEIELAWARVSESDFNGYKAKIEEWAGAKFAAQDENGTALLTATVNGKSIEVKAVYKPDASGKHIEGAEYDCQGVIIVTEAKNED